MTCFSFRSVQSFRRCGIEMSFGENCGTFTSVALRGTLAIWEVAELIK
jgi:hypothetical protein